MAICHSISLYNKFKKCLFELQKYIIIVLIYCIKSIQLCILVVALFHYCLIVHTINNAILTFNLVYLTISIHLPLQL